MATKNNPRPAPLPQLHFSTESATFKPLLPSLRTRLKKTLPHLPKNALEEVSIALVGNKTMGSLHAKSHNDPTPTDVLTYELDHTPKGLVTEGQIVICVSEARKRAKEHTIDPAQEVLLYALHGLLHLCGMDDLTKAEFTRMHKLEDQILLKIGVGALFHHPASKPSSARGSHQ